MSTVAAIGFQSFSIPPDGVVTGSWERSRLVEDSLEKYPLPLELFVIHDEPSWKLPSSDAAADDDFGCAGTFGTTAMTLETRDEKANAGAHAVYGRTSFRLPPEYIDTQTVQVVVAAGAKTTIPDASMEVDVEVRVVNESTGAVGAEICTTDAQDCKNLTAALKTFSLDSSGLAAGDLLDIRISITTNDAATATAVLGVINNAYMQMDIKG